MIMQQSNERLLGNVLWTLSSEDLKETAYGSGTELAAEEGLTSNAAAAANALLIINK